ncbi:MAG: hypothetical protein Q7S74_06700, partial [Nanoarchaeota archaeon]|nr:hypothetical protein [Nanoarchaeota archaeon]
MKTFSGESSIYIGREAGQEVMNAIRNAKTSVKIVSPYLSEFYVKELVKLHKMNRQITLITCDHISENSMYSDFKVSDLVVNRAVPEAEFDNKRKKGLRYSFILFVPSAVGLLSSMFVNALI